MKGSTKQRGKRCECHCENQRRDERQKNDQELKSFRSDLSFGFTAKRIGPQSVNTSKSRHLMASKDQEERRKKEEAKKIT